MGIQERIDAWKAKISELGNQYPDNKDGDVYGKKDMVVNMGKNLARIENFHAEYKNLDGAAAIEMKNQMEAYFINLDLMEGKLKIDILQK